MDALRGRRVDSAAALAAAPGEEDRNSSHAALQMAAHWARVISRAGDIGSGRRQATTSSAIVQLASMLLTRLEWPVSAPSRGHWLA